MRVLFVCHRLPFPPNRGGKIRPFNILRHLAEKHSVTVASIARSEQELEAGRELADHCDKVIAEVIPSAPAVWRMVARLPGSVPSSFGYFYSPRLAERIRQEHAARPFDLVFVHCSSAAQYVEDLPIPRKILDFGDMDSQKWLIYGKVRRPPLSLGYRLEGFKLEREERRLAGRFDLCTCTTRAELQTLESLNEDTPKDWFPNGVDLEFFSPPDVPYEPDTICFSGRFDYFPNQEGALSFCKDVFPRIRAQRPEARLTLVGANPSPAIRRLAQIPGVTVTGTVPDVRPHVSQSAVSVAPLNIARGTQNKILEALAMGVPVVASEIASFGVDVVPGEHLLTAKTPGEFAEAVLRLLDDADERRRFSEAGRARVESRHSWPNSMKALDRILDSQLLQPERVD